MGNKPSTNRHLKLIEDQATSIVLSHRMSQGQIDSQQCLDQLRRLSNRAAKTKHAKNSEIDAVITCIEDYKREISGKNNTNKRYSMPSLESHSFVAMRTDETIKKPELNNLKANKPEVIKPAEVRKPKTSDSQPASLQDITGRLKTLPDEIQSAAMGDDTKTLRMLEKTVQILSADLQQSENDVQQSNLQKQLTQCFNHIASAKKSIKKRQLAEKGTGNFKDLVQLEREVEEHKVMLETALKTKNDALLKHITDKIEEARIKLGHVPESMRKRRLAQVLDNMEKRKQITVEQPKVQNTTQVQNTIKVQNTALIALNDVREQFKIVRQLIEESQEDLGPLVELLDDLNKSVVDCKSNLDKDKRRTYTNADLLRTKARIYNVPVEEIKTLQSFPSVAEEERQELRQMRSRIMFLKDKLLQNPDDKVCADKLMGFYEKLHDLKGGDELRQEIRDLLPHKFDNHRLSVEDKFEHIISMQSSVNSIEEQLSNLDETNNGTKLTTQLNLYKSGLMDLDVVKYDVIEKAKSLLLEEIDDLLQRLSLRQQLDKLYEEVNQFEGTAHDSLYKNLETQLNSLLLDCDEIVRPRVVALTQQLRIKGAVKNVSVEEKELLDIEQNIDRLRSSKPDLGNVDLVQQLDEELIGLQMRLEQLRLRDAQMQMRRSKCFDFVKALLSRIRLVASAEGTLV